MGVQVLAANERGEVMEGCTTSAYFWRGQREGVENRWVTPSATSGGNLGTTRRWALEQGLAVEAVVSVESVQIGEVVWVSNGVRGFAQGVIRPWRELVDSLKEIATIAT